MGHPSRHAFIPLLIVLLIFLVTAVPALAAAKTSRAYHIQQQRAAKANPRKAFAQWVTRYHASYRGNKAEYERRYKIWRQSLTFAIKHNAEHKTHWVGLNHFADRTPAEFASQQLGLDTNLKAVPRPRGTAQQPARYANATALPTRVDWVVYGAVTPVKNQLQCGSCWSFSATGAMEGVNFIKTKRLISLSEQELIDCDSPPNKGCRGGFPQNAYQKVIDNSGLATEQQYPYKAKQGTCQNNILNNDLAVTIQDWNEVPANSETDLMRAVSHQPVSVCINANTTAFKLYAGGVFDAPCPTKLDHAVLAVGYGTDTINGIATPYWLVKNSWSTEWGENGYIKMARNTANPEGQCGITRLASYPMKWWENPQYSCPAGQYLRTEQCHSCVRKGSPFFESLGAHRCYSPVTSSTNKALCAKLQVPTAVRDSATGKRQIIVPCIDPDNPRIRLLLPRSNVKAASWLSASSYIKTTLRLAGAMKPKTDKKGEVLATSGTYSKGGPRMMVIFEDTTGIIRNQRGGTIKLTGMLNVPKTSHKWCFESSLKVCAK